MNNGYGNTSETVPPYISFITFLNAIESLTEHGVPGQIDSSVLKKFSGSVQRQLMPALKSMGLVDDNNQPTSTLAHLAGVDEINRKRILKDLIKERYPNQIPILQNGTVQQLRDSFNYIMAQSSVKSKCITFFLKAAEYSGFDIGHHLSSGMRQRGQAPKPPKKKPLRKYLQPIVNIEKQQNNTNDSTRPGLKQIPIPLGIDKIWYVSVDVEHTSDEVDKFAQMIKLVLG